MTKKIHNDIINQKWVIIMVNYEREYDRLKECFEILFGNEKDAGLIEIDEVKKLVTSRRNADTSNGIYDENRLIEMPENFKKALEETYLSRDVSYVNGPLGCIDNSEDQINGITNTALLIYLANRASKECRNKQFPTANKEKIKYLEKKENEFLRWKQEAEVKTIASIYVFQKTHKEYADYFSYGSRKDNEGKPSFVIDIPYIGQLCVHFGWEKNKEIVTERARDTAKTIIKEKMKLGQISAEEGKKILTDLKDDEILPEYTGKLYEYVGAMPIEYIGEKTKKNRQILGEKLPEEITIEDVKKMQEKNLNKRELYYFFIKMGAPKKILEEISNLPNMLIHKKNAKVVRFSAPKKRTANFKKNQERKEKQKNKETQNFSDMNEVFGKITIKEFEEATEDLKKLAINKEKESEKKYKGEGR